MSLVKDRVSDLQKSPASVFFPLNTSLIPGSPKHFSWEGWKWLFPCLDSWRRSPLAAQCNTRHVCTGLDDSKIVSPSKATNPDVPSLEPKSLLTTSPTPAVGLLLHKGVKINLKAFLMSSMRTREPAQPLTIWKRCRVQQLLRWSTATAKLPSAPRQLQRASPRLCKLLSESITQLRLFGQDTTSYFCFPLSPASL